MRDGGRRTCWIDRSVGGLIVWAAACVDGGSWGEEPGGLGWSGGAGGGGWMVGGCWFVCVCGVGGWRGGGGEDILVYSVMCRLQREWRGCMHCMHCMQVQVSGYSCMYLLGYRRRPMEVHTHMYSVYSVRGSHGLSLKVHAANPMCLCHVCGANLRAREAGWTNAASGLSVPHAERQRRQRGSARCHRKLHFTARRLPYTFNTPLHALHIPHTTGRSPYETSREPSIQPSSYEINRTIDQRSHPAARSANCTNPPPCPSSSTTRRRR